MPGGEPNLVTDDFTAHLTLEHRQQPRDHVEEAPSARHSLRRVQQPSRTLGVGRGRRPNMHFSSGGLSPSGAREAVDPIAELLSQLSGVRRAGVPYDRLLHRQQHTSSSSQQSSSAQRNSTVGARQSVILTETMQTPNSNPNPNHQWLSDSATQKHDKHQFLLDK